MDIVLDEHWAAFPPGKHLPTVKNTYPSGMSLSRGVLFCAENNNSCFPAGVCRTMYANRINASIALILIFIVGSALLRWGIAHARWTQELGAVKALSAAWQSDLETNKGRFSQLTPVGNSLRLDGEVYNEWIATMYRRGTLDPTGEPLVDLWGNEYQLAVHLAKHGRATGSVRSNGPDGIGDNDDDIVESFHLDLSFERP